MEDLECLGDIQRNSCLLSNIQNAERDVLAAVRVIVSLLSILGASAIMANIIKRKHVWSPIMHPLFQLSIADWVLGFLWIVGSYLWFRGASSRVWCFSVSLLTVVLECVTANLTLVYAMVAYFSLKRKRHNTSAMQVVHLSSQIWRPIKSFLIYLTAWCMPAVVVMAMFGLLSVSTPIVTDANKCSCWCSPHLGNIVPYSLAGDILVRNIGIAVFAGIAAFARLRCFNSINVDAMDAHSLRANLLSVNISIADTILLNSVNNIETGRDKVDMSGESKKDEKQYLNRLIREGEPSILYIRQIRKLLVSYGVILVLNFLTVFLIMIWLYQKVLREIRNIKRNVAAMDNDLMNLAVRQGQDLARKRITLYLTVFLIIALSIVVLSVMVIYSESVALHRSGTTLNSMDVSDPEHRLFIFIHLCQCITVPLQGFLNSIIYGLTVDDIGDSIMGDFMIKLHSQKNSDFHNISIEYGTDDGDDDETRSIIRS